MKNTTYTDFRMYLQDELNRRCRANPRYSLRRFANQLAIEPSALSKLLAKKRSVTRKMFVHLAERLDLSPEDRVRLDPIAAREGRSPEIPHDYRTIEIDRFRVISDWYHYAILELTTVRGFRSEPRWIAKTLGIPVSEANGAIERLLRMGMLEERGERWIDRSGSVTTLGSVPSHPALREMQKQVLRMGIDSLDTVAPDFRDHGSMTMAIDSKNLPAAKALLKKFRRDLCEILQTGQRRDAVVHLGTVLYPVTPQPLPRRKS